MIEQKPDWSASKDACLLALIEAIRTSADDKEAVEELKEKFHAPSLRPSSIPAILGRENTLKRLKILTPDAERVLKLRAERSEARRGVQTKYMEDSASPTEAAQLAGVERGWYSTPISIGADGKAS